MASVDSTSGDRPRRPGASTAARLAREQRRDHGDLQLPRRPSRTAFDATTACRPVGSLRGCHDHDGTRLDHGDLRLPRRRLPTYRPLSRVPPSGAVVQCCCALRPANSAPLQQRRRVLPRPDRADSDADNPRRLANPPMPLPALRAAATHRS